MSTKMYRKLVRDNIRNIIIAKGGTPKTRTLSKEGFKVALLDKLIEEATEVKDAKGRDKLMEELADVEEVRLAILDAYCIDPKELERVRKKRARERGSFSQKIFLRSVETK